MKKTLIIGQPQLKEVAARLGAVARGSKVLPVLECVHVSVKKAKAVFTATDLSVTIQSSVTVTCEDEFDCLIPFGILKDVVAITAGNIAIVMEEKALKIVHAQDELKLGLMDVRDFPALPELPKKGAVTLEAEAIAALHHATLSASKDELMGAMTHVLMDFRKDTLHIVSTDRYTIFRHTLGTGGGISGQVLIPVAACAAISGERLSFTMNDSHAAFGADGLTVICRRGDAKFPDYEKVLVKADFNMGIRQQELHGALQLCALSDSRGRETVITLKGTVITLQSDFTEKGNYAKTVVACDYYTGAVESIMVNTDRMLRAIRQLGECELLKLSVTDPAKAITMQRMDDTETTVLVMPLVNN